MICAGVSKERFRFIEGSHSKTFRSEQVLHRLENGNIVIDQTNFSFRSLDWRAHAAALVSCIVPEAAGKRTLCAIMQQTLIVLSGKPDA